MKQDFRFVQLARSVLKDEQQDFRWGYDGDNFGRYALELPWDTQEARELVAALLSQFNYRMSVRSLDMLADSLTEPDISKPCYEMTDRNAPGVRIRFPLPIDGDYGMKPLQLLIDAHVLDEKREQLRGRAQNP